MCVVQVFKRSAFSSSKDKCPYCGEKATYKVHVGQHEQVCCGEHIERASKGVLELVEEGVV